MGAIFDMMMEKRAESSAPISLRNPPSWLLQLLGGGPTKSGQAVDEEKAITLSTIYACVDIRSKTLATLPLHYYKRLKPRGKERVYGDPLYHLMHDRPNGEQTAFAWKRLMMVYKLLWGAGISEIEFDASGKPVALWPLHPSRVKVKRTPKTRQLFYEYTDDDGKVTILFPYQVFIISTMSTKNGEWLSPIGLHRETIGSDLAARDYGAAIYGSGINPAGILSGVTIGEEDTEETIRKKYSVPYQGLGDKSRLMILEGEAKFERIGLPPVDAQYLESRRFNVSEGARMYGIPLYMLADHEKQTSWGTGIEEQKDGYMTFTVVPDCVEFEQELQVKLVKNYEFFYEFMTAAMLRGTFSSRVDGMIKLFQNGFISPDDGRELENMNPLPDGAGNIYMVPMNLQNIEFAKERPVPNAARTPDK